MKALLHIQRFVDWDGGETDFGEGLPSNLKKLPGQGVPAQGAGGDAAMFIQKSSKMNDMTEFDEGFNEEDLF